MNLEIGQEYWSIEDGMRYEVSKIGTHTVYLTHYDGSCSRVKFMAKSRWPGQTEFVKSSHEAWSILLNNDVIAAQKKLKSTIRLANKFERDGKL